MTQEQHSITPPPELVQKWITEGHHQDYCNTTAYCIAQAARWGADQELDACVIWLISNQNPRWAAALQEARRPKPLSLKEQAQRILVENGTTLDGRMELDPDDIAIIRHAIESIPDEQ